ncbi:MAG: PIN domain-containing protein [Planctomycetota bacterium]
MRLTPATFVRGAELERLGLKPADALHVAAAEALGVDVLLSCDDRSCRLAARRRKQLAVRVANPLAWLKKQADALDA